MVCGLTVPISPAELALTCPGVLLAGRLHAVLGANLTGMKLDSLVPLCRTYRQNEKSYPQRSPQEADIEFCRASLNRGYSNILLTITQSDY